MGLRGPQPTPRDILRARGSRRADAGPREVAFTAGKPPCPAFLAGEGRKEWNRQVKELEAAGLLQRVDGPMLACWCEAWAEFVRLTQLVEERLAGPLPATEGQAAPAVPHSPATAYAALVALGVINAKAKAVERLLRLAAQFGFSPAARARIHAPEGEADEASGIQPRRRA